MDLTRLEDLKHKLVHGDSFGDAFEYFLDHFGDKPEFMALGEKVDDPLVTAAVERIGQTIFGESVPLMPPMLMALPEHHFVHGSCLMGAHLAVVIFFTELDMGIVAISQPPGRPQGETLFARFTAYEIDPEKAAGFEPRGSYGQVH